MSAHSGARRGHVADAPEPVAAAVTGAAHELVSPTAPGHDDASVAVVDLDQVAPESLPRRRTPLVAGMVAVTVLVGVTVAVSRDAAWVTWVDGQLHAFAVQHRGPLDVAAAGTVTWAGATAVALPVVALVGALAPRGPRPWRDRLGAGALLVAVASTGVYTGLLLNGAVGRVRPDAVDWAGVAGGPAFPSGHTTMGTLLAATCAWALSSRVPAGRGRAALWCAAALLAAGVGLSRWWLGVHWPTDVVGGWAFGTAWCAIAAVGLARWRRRSAVSG